MDIDIISTRNKWLIFVDIGVINGAFNANNESNVLPQRIKECKDKNIHFVHYFDEEILIHILIYLHAFKQNDWSNYNTTLTLSTYL